MRNTGVELALCKVEEDEVPVFLGWRRRNSVMTEGRIRMEGGVKCIFNYFSDWARVFPPQVQIEDKVNKISQTINPFAHLLRPE